VRALIPDPKSLNPNHPRYRRDRANQALEGRQGGPGPLQPREVTYPGNISMFDHVSNVRNQAIKELEVTLVRNPKET